MACQLLLDHVHYHFGHAFTDLKNDITVKSIANHHIDGPAKYVRSVYVAHKSGQMLLEKEVGVAGKVVTLTGFFAV